MNRNETKGCCYLFKLFSNPNITVTSYPNITLMQPKTSPTATLVSRSQTAFFRFSLWWRKKGSGDLAIEFAFNEIDRFCRALIAGDDRTKVLTTCAAA